MSPGLRLLAVALLAAVAGGAWWQWRAVGVQPPTVVERLQQRMRADGHAPVPCAPPGTTPLVLLALGQSNAGNHGEPGGRLAPVTLATAEGCVKAIDPLPGATGRGGSIWSRLPERLQARGLRQPVVLAVLAVDASSIAEWTDEASPLRDALRQTLASLRMQGLPPAAVLWQQGEADMLQRTPPKRYTAGMQRLLGDLRQAGFGGPLIAARSTRCRGALSQPLKWAVAEWARQNPGVLLGPDTDALDDPADRPDGCHFSMAGLNAAADLWAGSILEALPTAASAPR